MGLCIGLLVCLMLAGAWLGYWVVPKHFLTQEGSNDSSTAIFVAWSIRSCHDYSAITLTSWHLMVTICTLHVARRFNVFETKEIDTETMTKLAIIPFTVLSETLFLNKVKLCMAKELHIVFSVISE
ncbi:uncharacterized protein LOC113347246 isoform X2 [Papaver somniferum]|uniref:uncharacterized protein LOC113347246 isoform X2 n=1 Tax=Papaver somniferum TaxID=3469 RepID=UPI000E6F580E|nr:uncharacterized protein LOC113347246 isoform X2 [Papaver somniferum]